jgi:hypothetical protein
MNNDGYYLLEEFRLVDKNESYIQFYVESINLNFLIGSTLIPIEQIKLEDTTIKIVYKIQLYLQYKHKSKITFKIKSNETQQSR